MQPSTNLLYHRATIACALVLLFSAKSVRALPQIHSFRPDAHVEDADGHELHLRALTGVPILILYEDKGASGQNQAFKDELAVLAVGDKYRKAVSLVPVADVSAYDFWPVKGFVKRAIRGESKRFKTVIYCDWTGAFRKTLDLPQGLSTVLLFGKDGRLLFRYAGALPAVVRKQLMALLQNEL